jgi:hypothetical protein
MEFVIDLPDVLEELRQWLEVRDFSIEEIRLSGYFGDALVRLERDPVRIRFVRDRSVWDVQVRARGIDAWFDPALWEAAIAGGSQPRSTHLLNEKVDLLKRHLTEIQHALQAGETIDSTLEDLGRRRTERALGLPDAT